jgi:hypothetical protein
MTYYAWTAQEAGVSKEASNVTPALKEPLSSGPAGVTGGLKSKRGVTD